MKVTKKDIISLYLGQSVTFKMDTHEDAKSIQVYCSQLRLSRDKKEGVCFYATSYDVGSMKLTITAKSEK